MPVVLVGHSVAGLTTRLYVGERPNDVAGVVLLDPTVASFARMFDDEEFQPRWDGTTSADQVELVTTWPDIPFEILRHDPAVYASHADLERRHRRPMERRPRCVRRALVRTAASASCADSGHNIHEDAQQDHRAIEVSAEERRKRGRMKGRRRTRR